MRHTARSLTLWSSDVGLLTEAMSHRLLPTVRPMVIGLRTAEEALEQYVPNQ